MVFQLPTGSRGPGVPCCALRTAAPVTTVAETVELLLLSGPGQCPREPS